MYSTCFQQLKQLFDEKLNNKDNNGRSDFPPGKTAKLGKLFDSEHSRLPETVRADRANAVVAVAHSGWRMDMDMEAFKREIEDEPSGTIKETLRRALARVP